MRKSKLVCKNKKENKYLTKIHMHTLETKDQRNPWQFRCKKSQNNDPERKNTLMNSTCSWVQRFQGGRGKTASFRTLLFSTKTTPYPCPNLRFHCELTNLSSALKQLNPIFPGAIRSTQARKTSTGTFGLLGGHDGECPAVAGEEIQIFIGVSRHPREAPAAAVVGDRRNSPGAGRRFLEAPIHGFRGMGRSPSNL